MKKTINIIGIGGSIHDFSSCLLQNGDMKMCIEDERLVRKKHAFYVGSSRELYKRNAADQILDNTGITMDDVDMVLGNDILPLYYQKRLKSNVKSFHIINHHLAHACSAFYPSDFSEAAILTIDGGGTNYDIDENLEYERIQVCSYAIGRGNKVEILDENIGKRYDAKKYNNSIDPVTDSLGGFYGVATNACGFTFHEEGKTMGLAPYGTDKYLNRMMEYVNFTANGKFEFSIQGIDYFLELKELWEGEEDKEKQFNIRADIAYAAQNIVERGIIHAGTYLKRITGCENICIAGGVALNSVANYKLYKTGMFRNFFIQPAAGDNGTSIGAAYYGWYELMNQKRENK